MVFVILWLLGAAVTFLLTYPGGVKEMKRDWHSYKDNFFIYLGAMVLAWFIVLCWWFLTHKKRAPQQRGAHLKEVK